MTTIKRLPRLALHTAALLLLISGLGSVAHEQNDQGADAEAVIMRLQETWNKGDMTGYLAQYYQTPSMSLSFGNTVVQGWPALNDLFRASYPDPVRMGRFTIDQIDVTVLSATTAVAYGNFTHVFPTETIKGGFTHVLSQGADGIWRIQHERTSRGEVIETH